MKHLQIPKVHGESKENIGWYTCRHIIVVAFLFLPFASAANFLCRLLLLLLSKTMMLDKQHDKNENDGEKNDRNGEKNSGNNGITMVPPPIRLNLWYV